MPRIQLKLTAALAALVAIVVAVSGVLAERGLRGREMERIERSLTERAQLAQELSRGIPFEVNATADLDPIADRAGEAAGARVTLIARDGTVVGDSDVPIAEIPSLANHADRPEVRAALAGSLGRSTRRSATVGRRLFYLALPADAEPAGVVRLAADLSAMEAAIAELRRELLLAGAVGLAAALALAVLLSWWSLRPIEELRRVAASIAGGDLARRLPHRSVDELGEIADSINRMAEQLRLRLEEVTRDKEQLQAVLNGMVEGVLVVDTEGKIVLANARLRELFGIRGEVSGRLPIEVVRDATVDAVLKRASQGDEPISEVIHPGGDASRTLRMRAVGFPIGGGERFGAVAAFDDVTELVRLEQVRRDFVANASHELRTPLTAIRGFAETLRDGEGTSEADRRSFIEIIERHARRLGSLVDDLLELSTLESREAPLDRTQVDPAAIARALLDDFRSRFAEKSLDVSLDDSGNAPASADPRALEQILTNLVDNAVKYSEAGGRIEIRIESDERFVTVRVRDTGIGIPEADRERIFERFYRVDKARSRALGGTGLGLAIVKHLVQGLGGEIAVESRVGVGSEFRFALHRSAPAA